MSEEVQVDYSLLGTPKGSPCFNPNVIPAQATPEGHAGAYAGFFLLGYGYWFKSGQILSFPNSEIVQGPTEILHGRKIPDTYQKDCCGCGSAPWADNQSDSQV